MIKLIAINFMKTIKNFVILGNSNQKIVNNQLHSIGGAELQIHTLALELGRLGHSVFLIYPGEDNITIADKYFTIHSIPLNWAKPKGIYELFKKMCALSPDIIITRAANPLLIIYALISKIIHAKLIYFSAHDWELANGKHLSGWRWQLFRLGIQFCSVLFVQNEYQFQGFKGLLWKSSRVVRTKNLPLLDPVEKTSNVGDYFLWIGTYRPHKRPEMVVELAKQLPDTEFIIVLHCLGKEKTKRRFEKETQGLNNLNFMNGVIRDQMSGLYANARALLITSESEGFPNVALEAWSQGRAVITTPSTALSGLTEKQGCIIVETLDDFKKIIKSKSSDRLCNIGMNGLKYFKRNYSKDLIMDKVTSYL